MRRLGLGLTLVVLTAGIARADYVACNVRPTDTCRVLPEPCPAGTTRVSTHHDPDRRTMCRWVTGNPDQDPDIASFCKGKLHPGDGGCS